MTKCDFCKEEKETKTVHSTSEDKTRHNICKDCANIECPYLDWNKSSDWDKENS